MKQTGVLGSTQGITGKAARSFLLLLATQGANRDQEVWAVSRFRLAATLNKD